MADVTARATGHPLAGRASFLLSQLGAYSAHEFAKRLAPLGMRPGHFGLLMHLSRGEGQSQQRLADAMGIHRNVMVGLVDELEDRGLIERRRHPADRRAHAIHLTGAAHDLLGRAQRVADEHEAELLAGIGEDDRTYLIALLQHLAEHTGLPSGVHPGLNDNPLSATSRRC
jgi:DNA-binding MarR family transcriptional regulator